MNEILTAVAVLCAVGGGAALLLVIASRFLAVQTDERVDEIRAKLPGANCGACGFAGCDGYAKAVASGKAAVNLCRPGGAAAAKALAEIMGVEAGVVEKNVAYVACHGSNDATHDKYSYRGIDSCAACNMFYAGRSDCQYGCLGMGDCLSACKFDAIKVENGVAFIDPSKCTGCGACAAKCPKGLIHLVPLSAKTILACSNHDRAALTHKSCIRGCIGCEKCVRVCPNGALKIVDNLAVVDLSKCQSCGACILACPVNARSRINGKKAAD